MTMKVVTSVNRPYLRLFNVWLANSCRHFGVPLTVFCFDEPAYSHCADIPDVEAVASYAGGETFSEVDRASFWVRRLMAIRRLIDGGNPVVHTDIDAFWLQSPWPILEQIDADFVFTMDMGIPEKVREDWGFTLCCGFYLARPSQSVKKFFADWFRRTESLGDDQIALNDLIHARNIEWQTQVSSATQFLRGKISLDDGSELSIAVLPLAIAPRIVPFFAEGAIVAHPWFERPLFGCYLDLLEITIQRYGSLRPEIERPNLLLGMSANDFDECGLGAVMMIHALDYALLAPPSLLTLRAALCLRNDCAVELARMDLDNALKLSPDLVVSRIYRAKVYLLIDSNKREARRSLRGIFHSDGLELSTIKQIISLAVASRSPLLVLQGALAMARSLGYARSFTLLISSIRKRLASS